MRRVFGALSVAVVVWLLAFVPAGNAQMTKWAVALLIVNNPTGQALAQYNQRSNEIGARIEGVNCTALPGDDDCEYFRLEGVVPDQRVVTFYAVNGGFSGPGRDILSNNHRFGNAAIGGIEFGVDQVLTVEQMKVRVRQRLGELGVDRVWWVEQQTDTSGDLVSKFEAV